MERLDACQMKGLVADAQDSIEELPWELVRRSRSLS